MKIIESFEDFKKKQVDAKTKSIKQRIGVEKKKLNVLKKQKLDGKIKKNKTQRQDLQKKINAPTNVAAPPDVGGSNYFKQ